MVGYVLGPFIFAACMFGMVMQVRGGCGLHGWHGHAGATSVSERGEEEEVKASTWFMWAGLDQYVGQPGAACVAC